MSIESSPAASSPKILGALDNGSAKGKGKVKSDDEAAGLASGGFLALMTALEPTAEPSTELGVPGADPQPDPALAGLTPEPPEVLTGQTSEPVALSSAGLPNELAMLLAQGLSNVMIAKTLDISTHAARHHTQRVLGKMKLHSRAEAGAKLRG